MQLTTYRPITAHLDPREVEELLPGDHEGGEVGGVDGEEDQGEQRPHIGHQPRRVTLERKGFSVVTITVFIKNNCRMCCLICLHIMSNIQFSSKNIYRYVNGLIGLCKNLTVCRYGVYADT